MKTRVERQDLNFDETTREFNELYMKVYTGLRDSVHHVIVATLTDPGALHAIQTTQTFKDGSKNSPGNDWLGPCVAHALISSLSAFMINRMMSTEEMMLAYNQQLSSQESPDHKTIDQEMLEISNKTVGEISDMVLKAKNRIRN